MLVLLSLEKKNQTQTSKITNQQYTASQSNIFISYVRNLM